MPAAASTHVLSERTRAFSDSDPNDIDIDIGDLMITDRYMVKATVQRGLDAAFNTPILPAMSSGLRGATKFLA